MTDQVQARRTRKPISKRLRFEVYKRDKFSCVYCGRSVPEVVLVLDHVEAHSAGGVDDATNLVTACKECNAGKSDVPLGDILPAIGAGAVGEMQERVEQMRLSTLAPRVRRGAAPSAHGDLARLG